ncbi:hypothetical protein CEUSTIGMA_g13053.t1 [Chlamydomonas eustigma]|uniref:Uncharacterized protein n=1 Tax=Chlamydomonas eustigma TaxID=1157962 RepID=A0A250XRE3_9CHLO|nr:hypothetical protein CEUSTIGMA_g13053.t1 [Chlamydomonas eustigma]|eukprot:GAX85638.1 hypothetical protein CEUSTIGMA_g13053.t1 [Chlamydomonas eustigma]
MCAFHLASRHKVVITAAPKCNRSISRVQSSSKPKSNLHRASVISQVTDKPKETEGISRETEPEQYWSSPSEKKGANPFKDPLAIIGILSILFPFVLLGVAISTGLVDVSVYRYVEIMLP